MTPLIFVYGSLRRRQKNHHRLGRSRFVGTGTIAGALHDLGRYTCVRKTTERGARVPGELHELVGDDLEARFAALDRFEGSEFRRMRTMVRLRSGKRRWAWTYMAKSLPPVPPLGNGA